ncbi:hypothetical protein PTTG_09852 [Puccinia triticina 1-1 BBBD Race 1]|uniref:Uncharacterized protein n=1 Tax=Puccinia triticina (isolate 1-1 / race 1 (BBBD)) TaxID=630390 RepID=A0A180G0T8_PUCT1|nr:hypothetical protein PTTG_09852 [Puccinia triticina 1-1 BBBD Race 1]
MAPPSRSPPQITTPQACKTTEQKLEEITQQLAALTAGKSAPPHLIGAAPGQKYTPSPRNRPDFKCTSDHCFFLVWDTSRPIKPIVDQFSKDSARPTTISSFGQLEELAQDSPTVYDVDIGKRTRSSQDPEDEPTTSGKRTMNEKESLMDMDQDDLIKFTTSPSKPPPKSSPAKPSKPGPKFKFQDNQDQDQPSTEKPSRKTHFRDSHLGPGYQAVPGYRTAFWPISGT